MVPISRPLEWARRAGAGLWPGLSRARLHEIRDRLAHDWPIRLVVLATFANGLFSVLLPLALRLSRRPRFFNWPMPFGLYHWGRALTTVFGFVLIYVSFQLARRNRAAWWLALAGSLLATLAHLGHDETWYTAIAPATAAILLILTRKRFTVRSEPETIRRGLGLMVLSLAVALLYGTLGFWLLDKRDFGLNFTMIDSLVRTLREFTLAGNSDLTPHTRYAQWFLDSLRLLGIVAVAFGLYSLFRPVAFRLRTLPHQRAELERLLETHGGTSLDFFKLLPDKSYFFGLDRQSALAYRTIGGVAIGLGDPVGPPESVEHLLERFIQHCADNGWSVAFHQAQAGMLPIYERVGLQALKIGEEAIVDLERLPAIIQSHKHMRHTRNKFEKQGYKMVLYPPPHEPALLDQVEEVSNEWLKIPGRKERSFSLWRFDRSYLNACPLFVLYDAEGKAVAFANQVPSYRHEEATIDLMRHRLDVPTDTMDYLFMTLMLMLRDDGFCTFNLGMAPYAGVGDEPGDPFEERAAHQLAEAASRFVSYKGMRDYKDKFEPIWEDRFLVYQGGRLGLVKTALALVRATEG